MDNIADWSQLGIAGTVAISLGGVIAYVFKLFISVQQDAVRRAIAERDVERNEVARLYALSQQEKKDIVVTLTDVARVMSEVQQIMREREIKQTMEREFDRRGKNRGKDSL